MDKTHRTDRRTRYTRQAIKEILLEELKNALTEPEEAHAK